MKRLILLCLLLIGAAAGPARAGTTVYGPHASNATQTNVAAPTGTASTTGVMMGLAGAITPAHSGNVLLIVSGTLTNGTTSDGAPLQIRYGTGAAPTNGAALTGTTVGNNIADNNPVTNKIPFSVQAVVSGLAVGTAYWVDVGLAAVTGGTASLATVLGQRRGAVKSNRGDFSMRFYWPIAKVDAEQRMVWGYASTEAEDDQGETVSREALVAALDDYMRFANIREMHQPSAVGVAKEAAVDDKGLYLGAKIVDADAWQKVVEGVYKGFSIGGRVTARDPTDRRLITALNLTEIWDCGVAGHRHLAKAEAMRCFGHNEPAAAKTTGDDPAPASIDDAVEYADPGDQADNQP